MSFATDYLSNRSVTHPNSIALQWYSDLSPDMPLHKSESLSYLSLHRMANQTARWLRKVGLETEDRVAICMTRNVLFHVAMIGIMRAGGCYVPIDPDLPTERKAYIARDSGARFVLTATDASLKATFGPCTIFFEETSIQTAIREESYDEVAFATPDGLAFLLYTSGTTGNPKGCLLTHKGLSQAIVALSSTAADVHMNDLSQGRYLAVASVAFDVHLGETFVPIALGMPLVSAPRSQLLENLPLYAKLLGITHLGIVPSLIEATLGAVSEESEGRDMTLRYIASGGEKMSDAILDKWADHPKVRLANFYGPSEATIGCCARYMDTGTPRANIGHTFSNVAGYVVNANLDILPRGGIGELVVEGPLVGRGYIGRPDLTDKVFLEWPQKGDWAYRTGDLVRMMPDRTFEIIGRIDSQIKLRGVRIESEGISSIIRQAMPSSGFSLDAFTILGKHPAIGTEQLVSFVTWDSSVPVSIRKTQRPSVMYPPIGLLKSIEKICQVELPRYMQPSHVVPLSWLPLSSNGKTDVKVLAQIFHTLNINSLTNMIANACDGERKNRPASQLEMAVSRILARHAAVPLPVISPELNLFACGLDSMSAIRFARDLHDKFGRRVSASDIMSTPTLAGIASLIEKRSSSCVDDAVDSHSARFSCKWLSRVHSTYNRALVESILPPYSVQEGILSRSVDNDAFELVQVVLSPDCLSLPWLEENTDIGNDRDLVKWFLSTRAPEIAQDINRTLSETPGFRLSVFVADNQLYLVLSIHHALYDGISLPLLFQDVEREYHATPLLSLASPSQILDCIASVNLDKAREFWLNHFHGFVWPHFHVPSRVPSSLTIRHIAQFNSTLTHLKELSASQNVTLQTVLTSAFAVLAATRIYHVNDISFGIIRSGRLLPVVNIEYAICPMVSVVPTRVNFNEPGNVLHNVQARASAMMNVEHVPLGKVQNWVRPGRAIFDLLFSVSVKAHHQSDIWSILESQPPEADYALSVEVVLDPHQDTVLIQAACKDSYLDQAVIRKLIDDFETVTLDACTGKIMSLLSGTSPSTLEISDSVQSNDIDRLECVTNFELLNELRQILSNFLGIDEALLTESVPFVSLGLDSIKSVGLARTLKRAGHDIRAEEIMKYASLQLLTNRLTSSHDVPYIPDNLENYRTLSKAVAQVRGSFAEDDLKLSSIDKVTLFPTTTLQAGMLSQTIASNGSLYIHAFPLRIHSGVRFDNLENAWMRAIESLDIFRTSFHFDANSGIWAQAIHSISVTNLIKDNFETNEDYESKLSAFIEFVRPTKESDLHTPPIWLRLFVPHPGALNDGVSRLVLVMHHSLYDGLSVDRLLDMVQSFYLMSQEQISAKPVQFHNLLQHILHQEEHGTSFWTHLLTGFRPSYLVPRVGSKCHNTSYTASRTFSCDPMLLAHTIRHSEVTVQSLGQVTWGKLIAELTGSTDVVFGHVVSGRSIPDAEGVIGPVLNTIPCRVRLLGSAQNIDLLRSVHKLNVDALPWQHASLRSIQRELEKCRDPNPGKIILSSSSYYTADWKVQYAVVVELHQLKTGFMLKAACRPEYMLEPELEALLLRFQSVLENLMLHLDSPALKDISIQTPCESATVPVETYEEIIPPLVKSLLTDVTSVSAASFGSVTPLATLGIDSITAVQIVSRFRRAGLALSMNDIITSRTVGDMVSKVRLGADNTVKHDLLSPLQLLPDERAAIIARIASSADCVEDILPMSSGMKWMVGSWQKSGRTAFHHAFAFQLPANIDIPKLRVAWKTLLNNFSILRSTFACGSRTTDPRIVIFKPDFLHESWIEEQALDGRGLSVLAMRMKELLLSPPPTFLPPTKVIVCQSSQENYLILYLHHFQYDSWSLPLIIDDLSRLYLGLKPRGSNDIRSFLQLSGPTTEHLSQQKKYWQSTLGENFVPSLFPSLLSKRSESHMRTLYATKEAILKASLCAERARLLEVSLSSVLLACWATVQGSYSRSDSITVGLWQAGRSGFLDNIDSLAFPCLNIIPIQIPVPKRGEVIEIAKWISNDLRARSPVIVQSDLVNIGRWVGASERPLCNVVVNIIGNAPEMTKEVGIMKPIELPYYVPSAVPEDFNPTIDRLATTDLIQNDLIIDFAVLRENDTIMMSIDAGVHMLDEALARMLVEQWGNTIRETLAIS
ncbi:NRPS [Termitomyces sp. T32_za158]|nr:NRPS [Termitomyces sp. T32_za158]